MNIRPASAEHTLELRRTLSASRERVFGAWTEAEALARWFAPADQYDVVVHALDLRIGGAFRIEMRHKSGASHFASGTYREIRAPERLVFTWRWEANAAMPDTLVTIELHARGEGTECVLTHRGFASEAEAGEHRKGWIGCLDRLPEAVK
jgi:uncharacterized protein YndB with AHSA1/START domain